MSMYDTMWCRIPISNTSELTAQIGVEQSIGAEI